jgi:hypothetical protein
MAYSPGKRSNEYPTGVAKIAFHPEKPVAQVQFAPDQPNKSGEPFAGRKYKIKDWPEWVKKKSAAKQEWMVRLGKDGIYSMYPVRGIFTGKVLKFACKDGEAPTPKLREYNYQGKDISYLNFTVLLQITDGPKGTVGAVVPYTLRYNFGEDGEGNVEYTHWGANAKHSPILHEFLTAAGAWESGALKFSDNILPKLEKRILKAGYELTFQLKNGWVVSDSVDRIGGVDEDEADWDEEEDENEFAAVVEDDDDDFDYE